MGRFSGVTDYTMTQLCCEHEPHPLACSACDELIPLEEPHQHYMVVDARGTVPMRFHAQCHRIWQEESARLALLEQS